MDIFDKIAGEFGKSKSGSGLGKIQNATEQTPEETELVAYVRGKIDLVRQTNSRIAQEGIMFTNIAYLLGFDGVYYDTTYRQFRNVDPKRRLSRSRFKINKVLPTIQNRLSRLCQSPPKFDVRPNSNSSKDKDCARLAVQIIDDVLDKANFVEKQQELLMNAMQGGVSYVQVLWDDMLGKPMVDPETGDLGYEGDVRLEILNMLEVFPDPLAKTLDDAAWWIKAKVRKVEYFKDRYDRGSAVKEEDVWLLSSIYDLKANSMTAVGIVGAQTNEQMRNSAIEIVYYEKRSRKYPNGRKVVMANGVLLQDDELPIGEFDLIKFDDILIGGRYNSEAIITHLRPIQDQYNITRTKCGDWIKKMLGGRYLAAKGCGLSQESLNNDSGEVVEANPVPNWPGPVVQALPNPVIPGYVYEDIEVLSNEFNEVSGIGEVTQGQSPGSQFPFRAMALLVEQNQTRISTQTNRNEIGYARMCTAILKYVGKFYVMPRMLKVAGDGLEYTVKEFVGSDIDDNHDVICVPGSTSPNSKVLKRQDIINVYQLGLLGNPQDPKTQAKVLKYMEFGDIEEVWKDQAIDEQQIKKAIDDIENNMFNPKVPGHEWDNHAMFIYEMNQYRKTDKFDELDDRQKGIFNYVIEWHINALVQIQNPQVGQNQMMAEHMVNTMNNQKAQGTFGQPSPASQMLQAAQMAQMQEQAAQGGPNAPPQPGSMPNTGA